MIRKCDWSSARIIINWSNDVNERAKQSESIVRLDPVVAKNGQKKKRKEKKRSEWRSKSESVEWILIAGDESNQWLVRFDFHLFFFLSFYYRFDFDIVERVRQTSEAAHSKRKVSLFEWTSVERHSTQCNVRCATKVKQAAVGFEQDDRVRAPT